jgi:outer membrane protein assembly factor BamB
MKSFILFFVILLISSCSLDNKTGIWRDANNIQVDNKDLETISQDLSKNKYEDIFTEKKMYDEEKVLLGKKFIDLDAPKTIDNWLEKYATETNNVSNYSYTGNKVLLSKSSKLSKLNLNNDTIFYENNFISFDRRGKIFIYSLDSKKKKFEYNFYKKNFKKVKKKIYLIVKENILYIADSLGYLYAVNLNTQSLIWAKNFGIPFRSNMKIIGEQLFLANQDNLIYSININSGNKNWQFATSLTFLKSDFENNFVIDKKNNNLFFLNTNGEFYSINYLNKNINWVVNFKFSSLSSNSELFFSHPVVLKNNNLIVSTKKALLNYDSNSGNKKWNFSSTSILKPILTSNHTYILSKNNLLICIDVKTGEVLWSKNIYKNLTTKIRRKIGKFYDFKIANNEINLFSKNGYLLSFNYRNGNFDYLKKISKNGINSKIFFLKNNMLLLNSKNQLLKFN